MRVLLRLQHGQLTSLFAAWWRNEVDGPCQFRGVMRRTPALVDAYIKLFWALMVTSKSTVTRKGKTTWVPSKTSINSTAFVKSTWECLQHDLHFDPQGSDVSIARRLQWFFRYTLCDSTMSSWILARIFSVTSRASLDSRSALVWKCLIQKLNFHSGSYRDLDHLDVRLVCFHIGDEVAKD